MIKACLWVNRMSLTTDNVLFYLRYTQEEKGLLSKYLQFYIDLDEGKKVPNTEKQKHFVRFCRGSEQANTPHEFAYLKYKRIRTYSNKLKLKSAISDKFVKTKSNKETAQKYKYNSSKLSTISRRNRSYQKDSDFEDSAAAVRARNRVMLKDQENAIKLQAGKRLNVRNAMAIHSDPND